MNAPCKLLDRSVLVGVYEESGYSTRFKVGQALQTRAQIDVERVIKARLGCRHAVLQAS